VGSPDAGEALNWEENAMMKRVGFFGSLLVLPLFRSVAAASDQALVGSSDSGDGVSGTSSSGNGVSGSSKTGPGVFGTSENGFGILGNSGGPHAINAQGGTKAAILAESQATGVAAATHGTAGGVAAFVGKGKVAALLNGAVGIQGDTSIVGTFAVNGAKAFRIDHPFHPTTKYLIHSCVESNEMLNVYSGVIALDSRGEAEINLPHWFEALNEDFRYQLTAIGAPAPNLHIKQEIRENYFAVAGGAEGMKVSWQVAGRRHDAYAKAHPLQVEQDKPSCELGTYGHPTAFGQPAELASARVYWPESSSSGEFPD
jgi:hypothetical protein